MTKTRTIAEYIGEGVVTWKQVDRRSGIRYLGERNGAVLVEVLFLGQGANRNWEIKSYLPGYAPKQKWYGNDADARRAAERFVLAWFRKMAGETPAGGDE